MSLSSVTQSIASQAEAVTPSDTVPNTWSYLYVGTGGNVSILPENGVTAITFQNVPSGAYLWVRTSRVRSTGTTASNIIGHR
jgi:hypothetical protein